MSWEFFQHDLFAGAQAEDRDLPTPPGMTLGSALWQKLLRQRAARRTAGEPAGAASEAPAEHDAQAPAPHEASPAEAQVGQQVLTAIKDQAAQPGPGTLDPDQAYQELHSWTVAKQDDAGDPDTARVVAALTAKHQRAEEAYQAAHAKYEQRLADPKQVGKKPPKPPVPPLALDAFLKDGFFKQYWMLHCDQFADTLAKKINGPAYPSLARLRERTNQAIAKAGVDGQQGPVEIPGRDLRYRGLTLTELGARLKADHVEAGVGVHVKMRHELDIPYAKDGAGHQQDDFHHWFVYIGEGRFADSFGAHHSGAACDSFMQSWQKDSFYQRKRPGETFDYRHLHTSEYADAGSLAEFQLWQAGNQDANAARHRIPKPKAGVVPRVTALYRPRQAAR